MNDDMNTEDKNKKEFILIDFEPGEDEPEPKEHLKKFMEGDIIERFSQCITEDLGIFYLDYVNRIYGTYSSIESFPQIWAKDSRALFKKLDLETLNRITEGFSKGIRIAIEKVIQCQDLGAEYYSKTLPPGWTSNGWNAERCLKLKNLGGGYYLFEYYQEWVRDSILDIIMPILVDVRTTRDLVWYVTLEWITNTGYNPIHPRNPPVWERLKRKNNIIVKDVIVESMDIMKPEGFVQVTIVPGDNVPVYNSTVQELAKSTSTAKEVKKIEEEYNYIIAQACSCGGIYSVVPPAILQVCFKKSNRVYDGISTRCILCGNTRDFLFDITQLYGQPEAMSVDRSEIMNTLREIWISRLAHAITVKEFKLPISSNSHIPIYAIVHTILMDKYSEDPLTLVKRMYSYIIKAQVEKRMVKS
jgi:hypothetical protein